MVRYLQRLFALHIVRYALVGGIGIPINLAALAVFLYLMGDRLYPLALACSFEVSTTVNFILNQLFTYHEQKHLHGWDWVKRALKAQMTSLSALAVTYIIALVFKYGVHVSPYVASTIGIVSAFFYNFIISKRLVFRPATRERSEHVTQPASFRLTAHSLSSTSPGYIENGQRRTQDMQAPDLPEIATTPIPSFVSPEVTLSVVVPVMNERQNVRLLYEKLSATLSQLGKVYEIIFVDDGSTDTTFLELQKLHYEHPTTVHIIRFRRNFGKTPALVAGFSRSRGDVVFTMDGDLQDDPEEISNFLAKLDEGYDLVTGWKFPRHDPFSKTFPSHIFNGMVNRLTGLHLHDINCGFKAYRREVIEDIHLKLYGEFHRFVPVIAHWRGFRIAEIKVRHHPREFGISKFGARRFARGLLDLLTVWFLTSSLHTPLRLFGKLGFWTFLLGTFVDIFVVVRSFLTQKPIHDQPLLFVGILLLIFGFQFVLIGLLGEMIRHYAFQSNEEYSIRQELELCNHYDVFVPAEVHIQQGPLQARGRPLYPQSSQDREQLQSLWNQRDGSNHHTQSRNIPHRPTIIPL
jgi:glycosyltransferase involved in cell wall biosynthesis/putative flippase GtrA